MAVADFSADNVKMMIYGSLYIQICQKKIERQISGNKFRPVCGNTVCDGTRIVVVQANTRDWEGFPLK